jgi:hypothetical protein
MMSQPGFRLRHLVFHGPNCPPASLEFGPGLNILYGASETGKSFVVEAIDFMLGGKTALRDIPERVGYDRVILGIETLAGKEFSIFRSVDGGSVQICAGLYSEVPPVDIELQDLSAQHNEKNTSNLSMFLLDHCGLAGKRIRKNKTGETLSLSFRNLARLLIVTETEIMAQRSPLSDRNPVSDTPNFATFKLLLTGVDDSALTVTKRNPTEAEVKEAQLKLLDELREEYRERLSSIAEAPEELEDQLKRVDSSLSLHSDRLELTEKEYRELADRRHALRKKLEEGQDRQSEVIALLERFALLDRRYLSDVSRLKGLEEGGRLFQLFEEGACPLCGAEPVEHRRESHCEANTEVVVSAARSEVAKIELLRAELTQTVAALKVEASNFSKRLPMIERELDEVSEHIKQLVTPKLTALRASFSQLSDKRGEIREALSIRQSLTSVEAKRLEIEEGMSDRKDLSLAETDLSSATADSFAQLVEGILKAWDFPDAERVFFDAKSRDLIIAGKPRAARGKGLRAITHAAFTVGLLEFCRKHGTSHPGFIVLDTPLRVYRKPEADDEDLSGTNLDVKFYRYLASLPDDRQIIIVENTDPPDVGLDARKVVMFSKNPQSGRYGFFPRSSTSPTEVDKATSGD